MEGVVLLAGHHPARAARRNGGRIRLDAIRERIETLERAVEPVENAVVLDAHLHRQRPAGIVVRRCRRRAREREVVRVILRLEHVEHVRTERLRRLHHVRAGEVLLSAGGKSGGGAVHDNARLLKRDKELLRREQVRLVAGNHIAARQPHVRRAEQLEVLLLRARRAATTTKVCGCERVERCSATSTATAGTAAKLGLGVREHRRRHDPAVLGAELDLVAAHLVDVPEVHIAIS